jgi:hypothetical protein
LCMQGMPVGLQAPADGLACILKIMEATGTISTNPVLSTIIPNTRCASAASSRSFVDLSLRPITAR